MGRWEPNSHGRLQEAALALYSERGFDQTTAAEVAKRAGVYGAHVFRHFADKREVLFGGSALLRERIVAGVVEAPEGATPLDAVACGLDAAASMLGEGRRDLAAQRHAVIAANPEIDGEGAGQGGRLLGGRCGQSGRGVSEPQAGPRRRVGMTVFRVALERWANGDDGRDLNEIMRAAMADFRAVTADG